MVTNPKEAAELCAKYQVEFTGACIVTANGNIYLTGNVDPNDKSDQFTPGFIQSRELEEVEMLRSDPTPEGVTEEPMPYEEVGKKKKKQP